MSFEEDLKIGKQAEEEFKKVLIADKFMVVEVMDNSWYQGLDIDFFTIKPRQDKPVITVHFEVKNQRKISIYNSILLETVSNKWIDSIGWWFKTKADWLVFADEVNRKFYLFKLEHLKEYVELLVDFGLKESELKGNDGKFYKVDLPSCITWFKQNKKGFKKCDYIKNEHEKSHLSAPTDKVT